MYFSLNNFNTARYFRKYFRKYIATVPRIPTIEIRNVLYLVFVVLLYSNIINFPQHKSSYTFEYLAEKLWESCRHGKTHKDKLQRKIDYALFDHLSDA